jgi:hypothetical protein
MSLVADAAAFHQFSERINKKITDELIKDKCERLKAKFKYLSSQWWGFAWLFLVQRSYRKNRCEERHGPLIA